MYLTKNYKLQRGEEEKSFIPFTFSILVCRLPIYLSVYYLSIYTFDTQLLSPIIS